MTWILISARRLSGREKRIIVFPGWIKNMNWSVEKNPIIQEN